MVVIERPKDEKIENEIQSLEEQFQELKARISELRKRGRDTKTAEVLSLDFTPRVRMARATYEDSDIKKIKKLLDQINEELKEADEGSVFEHALEILREAYEYIRDGKISEAKVAYSAIVRLYKNMPDELKKTIYLAGLDVKDKIEKKER